ncbi:MAG: hypothetical protein ACYS1A_17045 [Planctomycetota bacterium]
MSQEQFNELLTQSELATINAAASASDTKQIKALVRELIRKLDMVIQKNPERQESPRVEEPIKVDVKQLWGIGGFLLLAFVIVIAAITLASKFGGGFWNFIAAIVASFVVLVVLVVIGRFMGVFSEGMVTKFLDVALKALRLGISRESEADEIPAQLEVEHGIDQSAVGDDVRQPVTVDRGKISLPK